MSTTISTIVGLFLKTSAVLLVFNEIRGLILAAPILYGMFHAGGSLMAIWIGFCSLAGVALSVFVPLFAARSLNKRFNQMEQVGSS